MGKMESAIRFEILRLAKKEVRAAFLPLRREMRMMKLKLSSLSRSFVPLERMAKEQIRQEETKKLRLEATPEEVKASRITPDRIRILRKRLGISQRELAILTGVTIGAVASWEKGKFKPKGDKKAALVALRELNKRDVKKMLAERAGGKEKVRLAKGKVKKPKGEMGSRR